MAVTQIERNWQFVEQYPAETAAEQRTRKLALELGAEPVSRATAAQLSNLVVLTGAQSLCEVGTGVGTSALALLKHAPTATLTSIDIEAEYQKHAKQSFTEAGITSSRLRLITGDAHQVLPRMNTGSYDLVLIDADPESLLDYLEQALQITRPGGTIVIPHALWRGRVADPTARDRITGDFRALLSEVADSPAIITGLSPLGDGLLTLTIVGG